MGGYDRERKEWKNDNVMFGHRDRDRNEYAEETILCLKRLLKRLSSR